MSVGESRVELDRSAEEFKSSFMLLLEREAVAHYAPGLRGEEGLFESVVAQVAQFDLLLKVPKTCREVLEAFKSVRLHFNHLVECLLRLRVLTHFELTPADLAKNPPCLVLLLRELGEGFDCF